MQNRVTGPLRLLALSLCMAVCIFLLSKPKALDTDPLPLKIPSSVGDRDDPEARMEYELRRLINPNTGKIPAYIRQKELAFAANLPTVESLSKAAGPEEVLTYSWSQRGPYNIGGRTRALGIDIAAENILLAGGVSGGMFRSTNGGASWTNTTDPSALHSISCLVQDTRPGKTNIWYYGSGEGIGNSASGGNAPFSGNGLFKSTNNGLSWSLLPSTATNTPHSINVQDYIWNVVTDPSNLSEDEVYYCYMGVVRRSTNGGTSWNDVLGGLNWPNYSRYIDIAITSSGVLYAALSKWSANGGYSAHNAGLYRSTDGTNWTNITPTGWPTNYRRVVIGIAPSNQNIVYFLAETPGAGFHVQNDYHDEWTSFYKYAYISGDGSGAEGAWENRSANLPAYGGDAGSFVSQNSYDLIVKVKPDNENSVFIGGTNLYRSNDGFASPINSNTDPYKQAWIGGYSTANTWAIYQDHFCDQHAMVFSPTNSNILFTGNDGGVQKTMDATRSYVNWQSLNNGYITTQYYTIAIDRATSGSNAIFGGMQDNGTYMTTSTNPSAPWEEVFSGDGSYCAIANGGGFVSVYVSYQNGGIYRLVYNSQWRLQNFTRVDPTGGTNYLFINPFTLDPNNSKIMYVAGGDRVWRNSDLTGIPLPSYNTTSVNWTQLTNTIVTSAIITALGMSKVSANRLYYGTTNGQIYRLDGTNSGNPAPMDVWTGKGFPQGAYVSCIMVDPTNADRVMVVFSNYEVQSLFYTTNGGTSWTNVSGNLEQNPGGSGNGPSCRWASMVHTASGPVTFVGTSTGLYSTSMLNGTSTAWALEGATVIGNVVVDMMDTRQSDGLIIAATHGKGVFSAYIESTGIEIADNNTPTDFSLEQNYPNPFNPKTSIQYSLPAAQRVSLKVYDTTGREVASLVEEQQSAGIHKVDFEAGHLASGVYVYRLTAGVQTQTKKLTLLK
ncbi:MAG: T9SS type A sorting domain-containing protein [bacterium]